MACHPLSMHPVLEKIAGSVNVAVIQEQPEALLTEEHLGDGFGDMGLVRGPGDLSGERCSV